MTKKGGLEIRIKADGKLVVLGNMDGLDDLQQALYKAMESVKGVAETKDKRWKAIRLETCQQTSK